MRLLFDEQLSEKLVSTVAEVFPGALHVRLLNRDIVRLLIAHANDIRQFDAQSDATVLELGEVLERPNTAAG